MLEWLPSERRWLDDVTERVLDGEILLVRALPGWGLSAACRALEVSLGESAVLVDGRTVIESTQGAFRERLDSDVHATITKTGFAQLLFDNYGRAIRRSQGGLLHSMLYRLLVDSPTARDTGALLVARPNELLDPGFPGSPLLSRARTVLLPVVGHEDAEELGIELSDLRILSGDSTWLARRFLDGGLRQGRVGAVEHLDHDRRRIVAALPPEAVSRLARAHEVGALDGMSREAMMCLGSIGPDDTFEPASLVAESKLLQELDVQNPAWPDSLVDSGRRFADLLAGAQNAFWVDRYIFSQPVRAREFLDLVRNETSTHLRLLVCDDRERGAFAHAIASALAGIAGVEVKFVHWSDKKLLHDRHLVLPALQCGYILPTAGVLLAIDHPGTAVSARIPAIDYSPYWNRGSAVFPSP